MRSQAIHKRERDQFIKLFKDDRIDRFEDRLAVLEVFLRTEHHVTLKELADAVRQSGHRLDDEFVRETIDLMCHYGFARVNRFDNGNIRYEHRHLGQHHDHLICTKCKKIIEFENEEIERLQRKIASNHGFHMLQHKMELYGICRECLARRDVVISLDAARTGERLKVVAFNGGARFKLRLLTMGLRVGDEIEVITNIHSGQVVVAADYNRLVLGQGLASKIMVSPVTGQAQPANLQAQP